MKEKMQLMRYGALRLERNGSVDSGVRGRHGIMHFFGTCHVHLWIWAPDRLR
jgi:hypothetical protein